MEAKTYNVNGIELQFKEMTLDEGEKIEELFSKISVKGNSIVGNFTNSDVKKMFSLILEPLKPCEKTPEFGDIKETQAIKIIADFFLLRMSIGRNIINSFNG